MKINSLHNLSGEQKNQLLIVTDKKGQPIGKATRDECHKGEGKTHLAFLAFVVDREGKIILARRSKKKSLWGGFWDASVVSHILPNETSEIAAKRRGREELGIDIEFKIVGSFYYHAKFNENAENEYCYILIGKTNKNVIPNPIEIEEIRKISIKELSDDIKKRPEIYTPWIKLSLGKINIKEGFT